MELKDYMTLIAGLVFIAFTTSFLGLGLLTYGKSLVTSFGISSMSGIIIFLFFSSFLKENLIKIK